MNTKTGPARRAVLAGAVAAPFLAGLARAQAWPARSITLVVPFAPGGGTDTFARPFAAKLSQELGQQVVIDNRAGAGGTVGAAMVAKAKPDGYTFLLGSVHHAVAVTAYKQLSYELEKDLAPVTSVASVPDVLVVYPGISAKTLQEFIAYCKANPGKVNYGSAGLGTTRHLAGEIFNEKTGAGMTHVPYKGSGPATAALISGEVTAVFEGLGSAAPYIRSGRYSRQNDRLPFPISRRPPRPACRASSLFRGMACGRRPAPMPPSSPGCRPRSRRRSARPT